MSQPYAGETILVHGMPKTGKTKLATSFPGLQMIACAPGGHGCLTPEQKKARIPIKSWADFEALTKNGSPLDLKKHTTFCIDYVRALYRMCKRSLCVEAKVDHFSDKGPYGMTLWDKCTDRFGAAFGRLSERLMEREKILLLIDHTKEESIEDTSKLVAGMPKQAWDWIGPAADHIWFLGYGDPEIIGKSEDKISDASAVDFRDERMLVLRGGARIQAGTWDHKMRTQVIYPLLEPDLEKKTGGYWQIIKETQRHVNRASE